MRYIFALIFFILSFNILKAQQNLILKDSLSITKEVQLGNTIKVRELNISFLELVHDSRCPKDVTCVRAGEADLKLVVSSAQDDEKIIAIRIDASAYITEENNLVYEDADYRIFAYDLTPYPLATSKIENSDYILELLIKPKAKQ